MYNVHSKISQTSHLSHAMQAEVIIMGVMNQLSA